MTNPDPLEDFSHSERQRLAEEYDTIVEAARQTEPLREDEELESRFLRQRSEREDRPLFSEQIYLLMLMGCAAWKDRDQCGAAVRHTWRDTPLLRFQTACGLWLPNPPLRRFTADAHPDALYAVGLCERHGPTPEGKLVTAKLMQDMAGEYMAFQLKECAAWLAQYGRRLDLGTAPPRPDTSLMWGGKTDGS